jgi:hypothetical protein
MLETEIKNLTAQIEKLNSNFEALFNSANGSPVKQEKEPLTEETKPTITRDSLRELCLTKVRGNSTNKTKVKDILKTKGASLVDDLKEEDLEEVQKLLGAL